MQISLDSSWSPYKQIKSVDMDTEFPVKERINIYIISFHSVGMQKHILQPAKVSS